MFIYFERLLNSPLAVVPASLVLCGLLVMPAVAVQEPEDPEDFECPDPPDDGAVCAEAGDRFAGEQEDGAHELGRVVCCDGVAYACVHPSETWPSSNLPDMPSPQYDICLVAVRNCVAVHEASHVQDQYGTCEGMFGFQRGQSYFPSINYEHLACKKQASECIALQRELWCVQNIDEADCYGDPYILAFWKADLLHNHMKYSNNCGGDNPPAQPDNGGSVDDYYPPDPAYCCAHEDYAVCWEKEICDLLSPGELPEVGDLCEEDDENGDKKA